ncbi:Retrovirus-related Pol polyprotein from transposon TNT 1-94 [Araneus ventricosus]|uniref:Retrovirus-related Pol polyprotein from transposon TNT 1-94 n=1 Tax=Araneus ventricosus TaxID=182803 RepID=A0A4Y2DV34_ARAVE|nr:Retrovirus-related Pol polyprotein from transposon TNT 1-94 [Araneus ventricosus]
MSEAKPATTSLSPNIRYQKVEDNRKKNMKEESAKMTYRQAIGSLFYLACGTRPDLAYASTFISQFNGRPDEGHWKEWSETRFMCRCFLTFTRLVSFLRSLQGLVVGWAIAGIKKKLQDYSDADWGGDTSDRMSFSGYMLLLAGARVSWSSNKQTITALSSTEAEYIAMCHVAKEALWINSLLREISVKLFSVFSIPEKVLVDNQEAIFIAKNQRKANI